MSEEVYYLYPLDPHSRTGILRHGVICYTHSNGSIGVTDSSTGKLNLMHLSTLIRVVSPDPHRALVDMYPLGSPVPFHVERFTPGKVYVAPRRREYSSGPSFFSEEGEDGDMHPPISPIAVRRPSSLPSFFEEDEEWDDEDEEMRYKRTRYIEDEMI
jgi:hypothetical protein